MQQDTESLMKNIALVASFILFPAVKDLIG